MAAQNSKIQAVCIIAPTGRGVSAVGHSEKHAAAERFFNWGRTSLISFPEKAWQPSKGLRVVLLTAALAGFATTLMGCVGNYACNELRVANGAIFGAKENEVANVGCDAGFIPTSYAKQLRCVAVMRTCRSLKGGKTGLSSSGICEDGFSFKTKDEFIKQQKQQQQQASSRRLDDSTSSARGRVPTGPKPGVCRRAALGTPEWKPLKTYDCPAVKVPNGLVGGAPEGGPPEVVKCNKGFIPSSAVKRARCVMTSQVCTFRNVCLPEYRYLGANQFKKSEAGKLAPVGRTSVTTSEVAGVNGGPSTHNRRLSLARKRDGGDGVEVPEDGEEEKVERYMRENMISMDDSEEEHSEHEEDEDVLGEKSISTPLEDIDATNSFGVVHEEESFGSDSSVFSLDASSRRLDGGDSDEQPSSGGGKIKEQALAPTQKSTPKPIPKPAPKPTPKPTSKPTPKWDQTPPPAPKTPGPTLAPTPAPKLNSISFCVKGSGSGTWRPGPPPVALKYDAAENEDGHGWSNDVVVVSQVGAKGRSPASILSTSSNAVFGWAPVLVVLLIVFALSASLRRIQQAPAVLEEWRLLSRRRNETCDAADHINPQVFEEQAR